MRDPPDRRRDPDFEDYQIERDFQRRYGPRLSERGRDHEREIAEREAAERHGRLREPRSWLSRTTDEVESWFGNREALRRRQWDEAAGDHRGKGPKAYRRADDRILEDVSQRMADDPELDASDIEVTVADGEVTLNGFVRIRADKRLAEDIAESAGGVTHVQNNLRVGSGPEAV
jgi:osmotically-inducible protein OsmY